MNKYLIAILKFGLAVGIIAWLVANLDPQKLAELQERSIDWSRMSLSFTLCLAAVCLTFVRWRMLVRALDIPFGMADAFRLGFLGYLLNFVSVGLVGGDLFKAVFIARQQPGRRAEAVATVLVDRVLGLYALLVVTTLAILLGNVAQISTTVRIICNMTIGATVVGAVGIALLLSPLLSGTWAQRLAERLPFAGPIALRLLSAVRVYRSRPGVLLLTGLMSLAVHSTLALAIYLAASALYEATPTLAEHLVIVPLSLVAGALPFTPAGMGTFEGAMAQLYKLVSAAEGGLIVALAYRLITIGIAAIGGVYYVLGRSEVDKVLQEAADSEAEEDRLDSVQTTSASALPSSGRAV